MPSPPQSRPSGRIVGSSTGRRHGDLPYEGQFDDIVPHLTIGDKGSAEELRAVERAVLSQLPISMEVTHAQVICGTTSPGSWETIGELPLGENPGGGRPFHACCS